MAGLRPRSPQDCGECMAYLTASPGLVSACASVGTGHGRDTRAMLNSFLAAYHERGHQPEAP